MSSFVRRHGWIIGIVVSLFAWVLLLTLKELGRPITDAELGYLFAIGGVCLIIGYSMSSSARRIEMIVTGTVVLLASLEWIVMPEGSSHLLSTTGLLCCVAYAVIANSSRILP